VTRGAATIALAIAAAAVSFAPTALAARVHTFKATYTGHGAGEVTATAASGHASASGSGNVIGRSTLSGMATGVVRSPTCVAFNGKATLKGSGGSIVLRARGAQACTSGAEANVAFSGTATVTGGTRKFAGARGTLSFKGVYAKQAGSVTISFKGRVTY
jgi:hypothetical protein